MSRTKKTLAKRFVRAGHPRIADRKTHRWMRRCRINSFTAFV